MNNTLANGLTLLALLSRTAEAHRVSDLATALALPKSHVHRLLQTLVDLGYAVQQADRTYRIGLRPLEISSALLHHLPLRSAALPILHDLAARTRMDAIVCIPVDGGAGLIVGAQYADGLQRDPAAAIGSRLEPGSTATGTLFAACMPGAVPTNLDARRIERIRRERFAVKDADLGPAINGMAALVTDGTGAVLGSLGLSAPGDLFRRRFTSAAAALRRAAKRLGDPSVALQ